MNESDYMLTAQQYNELYCRAFARLDDVVRLAEQAMGELEELQLSMAEQASPSAPEQPLRGEQREKK